MSVLLCTAFLQKLHCARVSHGMAQFVLKMAHLSIFDGTNPITGKGVSYSILQRFWVVLVS